MGSEQGQVWLRRVGRWNLPTRVQEGHREQNTLAKPAQNAYPVWTVFSKNISIDFTNICMRNYNVHVSFQKNFCIVFFLNTLNPHIYIVFFLPLKMMSCMSHFGTLHRKKWLGFLFFCSGRNHLPESVQMYYSMSFFFLIPPVRGFC